MSKSNSSKLSSLREEIKRLAEEGRSYNPRIAAAAGPERHALRQEKGGVGYAARVALLAYAMLRGVPYRRLERVTSDTSWSLTNLSRQVAGKVQEHCPPEGDVEEGTVEWMNEDPPGTPAAEAEGASP